MGVMNEDKVDGVIGTPPTIADGVDLRELCGPQGRNV